MNKADRELAALQVVYNPDHLKLLEPGDKPDFVLAKVAGPTFGVEVTDIYQDEANARLINRPEYITQLFSGGRHMHKDDIEILQVTEFTISDPDGKVKQEGVVGVLQRPSHPSLRYERLAQAIREKTAKCGAYRKDLAYINLIVVDHFSGPDDRGDDYHTTDLFSCGVREALSASPFQEVFLVGRDRKGQSYYRPLWQILLMEQFRLFAHAAESFDCNIELQDQDVLPLFVCAMEGSPLDLYYAVDRREADWAISRGCAVRLGEKSIELFDYADMGSVPEPCAVPHVPLPPAVMEEFRSHLAEFVSKNGMSTGYQQPATVPVDVPEPTAMEVQLAQVESRRA